MVYRQCGTKPLPETKIWSCGRWIEPKVILAPLHKHSDDRATIIIITFYLPCIWQCHWNRNVFILMKFSSLAALEVVKMTTSSPANDENFVKMTTFSSLWCPHQGPFQKRFSIIIQIRWKVIFSATPLYNSIWQQNVARATTAQMSRYVQNFIAIVLLKPGKEQN